MGLLYREVVLEKVRYAISHAISNEVFGKIDVDAIANEITDAVVFRIRGEVLGESLVTYRFPANWWEGVKDRWLRWLPWVKVRYVQIDAKALYPKVALPDHKPVVKLIRQEWIE